jgi:hypothetical protein
MTPRNIWLGLVLLALVLVAIANAHLVYVAVASQSECVEHLKTAGGDGRYRAAKPAC